MAILPFLLVVLAVAFYFTTAEERLRIIRAVPPLFRRASHAAAAAGLYGLFLASLVWTFIRRGELTIPLGALKKLAPVAAVFALVQLAGGNESSGAVVVGFLTGGVCGCVLTTEVADRKPRAARLAATAGAVLTIAAASGVPLRGVTDVRPELERVVALEQRTVPAYEAAVEQFKLGRMKPEALAKLIERTI